MLKKARLISLSFIIFLTSFSFIHQANAAPVWDSWTYYSEERVYNAGFGFVIRCWYVRYDKVNPNNGKRELRSFDLDPYSTQCPTVPPFRVY